MKNCIQLNEKKEFIAIDFFKMIFSLMVVCIHIPAFFDINKELSFFINQIICRLAVPFFFISSGFFMYEKMKSKQAFLLYIKRLFVLYSLYTVLYIPQIINGYIKAGYNLIQMSTRFLQDFFLVGSYIQLWYFIALIVAVSITYILAVKFAINKKLILIILLMIYFVGVVANSYEIIINNSLFKPILESYISIFHTTRNGLFFGSLYVYIGYLIANNKNKITSRNYILISLFCIVFVVLEGYLARYLNGLSYNMSIDMLFTLPLASCYIFLSICFIKIPIQYVNIGKLLRNISTITFGLHIFVNGFFNITQRILGVTFNSLFQFSGVSVITIVIATLVIYLSKDKLPFLKWLY